MNYNKPLPPDLIMVCDFCSSSPDSSSGWAGHLLSIFGPGVFSVLVEK